MRSFWIGGCVRVRLLRVAVCFGFVMSAVCVAPSAHGDRERVRGSHGTVVAENGMVLRGESVDTTMGFTPLEGLVMGTRGGDMDPGIIFHLANKAGMSLDQINTANAGKLRAVCAFQAGGDGNFQVNPIVYDGTMYITTVNRTLALDASDCKPIWKYTWTPRARKVWTRSRPNTGQWWLWKTTSASPKRRMASSM